MKSLTNKQENKFKSQVIKEPENKPNNQIEASHL